MVRSLVLRWAFPIKRSAHRYPQRGHSLGGRKTHRELVISAAADFRILIAVLSHPHYSLRVHKHFLAMHILEHYKLHVASFGKMSYHSGAHIAPTYRPY